MPKIPATLEQTFVVLAPMDEVYTYFLDPKENEDDFVDLVSCEDKGEGVFSFVGEKKTEKGTTFQPLWTCKYEGEGGHTVTWKSLEGNADVEGSVKLRSLGDDKTEVIFKETWAPDLPINAILAKVFKPIVAREVKKGIEKYLNNVRDNW